MNDEKKDTNPVVGDDDNPWDDDGGGRTLATDGPSFEVPSNIPSPITVPPPAPPIPPAPSKAKATLVGLMPDDFMALARGSPGAPPAAAPRSSPPRPAMPSSARMPVATTRKSAPDVPTPPPPVVLAADNLAELPGQQEDGPTMAIASPLTSRPLRDDIVNPRHAPMPAVAFPTPPVNDKDAETMALDGDDPRLPPPRLDAEETTRAVSRDEMMRHRDAQVVVGEDAMGDDATLALAPGQVNLGMLPGADSLGPPLASAQHYQQPAAPPYMQQQQHQHQPPPQHQQPPSSYRHPPVHQGFDPMMPQQPQQNMQGYAPPPQSNPMGWGPPPNAATAYGPGQMQGQGMMQQAAPPAPWGPPPQPQAETPGGGLQITPQIMLLVGVGVVCLAIFVIGIVLFVTTKF